MWYEHNRETPPRPYLAVACTAIALAVATGLAWLVTGAQSAPAAESVQSLDEWPITFTLPAGISWVRSSDGLPEEGILGGMEGTAAYVGRSPEQRDSTILVRYEVVPTGTTLDEAMLELMGRRVRNAEKIQMGPLVGAKVELQSDGGSTSLLGIACSERGLVLIVAYATLDRDSRARLAFEAACRSIQYKSWSVGRRKHMFLPPGEFEVSTKGEPPDSDGS